jgi:hypothetical protein
VLQVVPAYVAHENLDSVNLLIMWDSQSETLAQGTLSNVACQELARQRSRTTASNIVQHLKPALEVLLMVMLKPAHMSSADMHAFADAMVEFHNYFIRVDWESTWASSLVGRSVASMLNGTSRADLSNDAVLLLLLIRDSPLQKVKCCTCAVCMAAKLCYVRCSMFQQVQIQNRFMPAWFDLEKRVNQPLLCWS